jgi:hypothetical protein
MLAIERHLIIFLTLFFIAWPEDLSIAYYRRLLSDYRIFWSVRALQDFQECRYSRISLSLALVQCSEQRE